MVTNDHLSLKQVLNIIGNKGFNKSKSIPTYSCPYCHMSDLTEDELWHHIPLYHVNDPTPSNMDSIQCPICTQTHKHRNFLLHLRNNHGPTLRGEVMREHKDGILTHAFALVVVRRPSDNKFLVVQESNNSGFWLPGGRVDVGETLLEAAIRETKQEAGIDVDIKGVLKVEHSTYQYDERERAYNRMRIIFYAEPSDESQLPKSVPDFYSAGATFISVDELDKIRLRADEPKEWFVSLTDNFYYHPLDILSCWKHDCRTNNIQNNVNVQQTNNNNNNVQKIKKPKIFIPDEMDEDDEPIPNNLTSQLQQQQINETDENKEDEFGDEYSLSSDEYEEYAVVATPIKRRYTVNGSPTVKENIKIRLTQPGVLSKGQSAETGNSRSMRNVYAKKPRRKHNNTPTDTNEENIKIETIQKPPKNKPKISNLGSVSNKVRRTKQQHPLKQIKRSIASQSSNVLPNPKSPTKSVKSPTPNTGIQQSNPPLVNGQQPGLVVYQFAPVYHPNGYGMPQYMMANPPQHGLQPQQGPIFRAVSDPNAAPTPQYVQQIPTNQYTNHGQLNQYPVTYGNPAQRFSVPPTFGQYTPMQQQLVAYNTKPVQNNNKNFQKQPQPEIKAPVINKNKIGRKGKLKHRRSLSNGAIPLKDVFKMTQKTPPPIQQSTRRRKGSQGKVNGIK